VAEAVIWDFEQPAQILSNRPFYTKVLPSHPSAPVQLQVTHLASASPYELQIYRTGYHANDAYSAYLEMGAPKDLSPKEVAHLTELTRDQPETDHVVFSARDGRLAISVPMNSNDVVLLKLVRTGKDGAPQLAPHSRGSSFSESKAH